jgi:GNAT superfamily N-acetyltransferase
LFNNLKRLDAAEDRPEFNCGDDDLNDFYFNDSRDYAAELMAVTYVALHNDTPIGYFCVTNDSIRKIEPGVAKSAVKRIFKRVPHVKRFTNLPSVKIGRLAVCNNLQRQSIGTQIIDFIKYWFKVGNKTGCRFIVVDAYNNDDTIKFYEKNGFIFMSEDDKSSDRRIMYYDLKAFNPDLSNTQDP